MLLRSKVLMRGLLTASAAIAIAGSAAVAGRADETAPAERMGLPDRTLEDASAYEQFVNKAGGVSSNFADGNAVRRALKTGASFETQQLQSGEVAYAALLALKNSRFVEGVSGLRDQGRTDELADRLVQDPNFALRLPGADGAAANAAQVLSGQGQHVYDTGAAVKQSAYTIQHQAWSRSTITDRAQRLAQVKTLSQTRVTSTAEEMKRLMTVLSQAPARSLADSGYDAPAPASPVVARGVALAALAVLGRARSIDAQALHGLTSDTASADCLKLAKLNLYQCLAVAGPRYEDVFCLGEHGLKETGKCLSKAATARNDGASGYGASQSAYDPRGGSETAYRAGGWPRP